MVQGASKGGRTARRSTNVPFSSTQVHAGATQPHEGPRRPTRPTKPHEGPRSPTKPHEAPRRPTKPHASLHRNKQQQDCSGISVWSFSCCRAEICNLAESGLSPPVPGEKPAPEQLSCHITSDTTSGSQEEGSEAKVLSCLSRRRLADGLALPDSTDHLSSPSPSPSWHIATALAAKTLPTEPLTVRFLFFLGAAAAAAASGTCFGSLAMSATSILSASSFGLGIFFTLSVSTLSDLSFGLGIFFTLGLGIFFTLAFGIFFVSGLRWGMKPGPGLNRTSTDGGVGITRTGFGRGGGGGGKT